VNRSWTCPASAGAQQGKRPRKGSGTGTRFPVPRSYRPPLPWRIRVLLPARGARAHATRGKATQSSHGAADHPASTGPARRALASVQATTGQHTRGCAGYHCGSRNRPSHMQLHPAIRRAVATGQHTHTHTHGRAIVPAVAPCLHTGSYNRSDALGDRLSARWVRKRPTLHQGGSKNDPPAPR